MFDLMWPSVESGQILLLLTSRTDIGAACQARLLRYHLFKNIKTVELGEGQFALKVKEKATFWSKLCGKLGLPEDAIAEICNMKTFLGFPKCCTLFASTKGVRKYGCAYDFLATDVKTLKGNDKVGYFVLLLILVTDGLDKKRLDRPTREFKDEIETLADTCIDFTPNCKMIKDKLEQFCGIYLTRKRYKYTFKNMFAFNAAFLEFASTHLDMLLPVSPASTLVRIVRTAPHQLGTSTVSLTGDSYDEFVKHILCTLQQGDRDILDHPCFHEDMFIRLLIQQADADSAREIATKDLGAATVDIPIFSLDSMVPTSTSELLTCLSYMFRSETIIRYSYQLSFMIMKGLVGLVKLLLDQLPDTIPRSILSESLTCAVYANDNTTVTILLDKGASPNADTLTALCSVADRDVVFVDKVLGLLDLGSVQDTRKLLSLAMQCGNFTVANLLIKELIASGQTFASCLIQLLYQHSGLFKQGSGQQATDPDMEQLVMSLLDTRCSYDYHLLCLAAGHPSPVALKLLIATQLPAFNTDQVHEQAKHAALYGSFQCLQEHLHHSEQTSSYFAIGVTRETLLHYSARSMRDSHMKINLLASSQEEGYGVNVIDKYGNTPLHFAALLGDSKCVQTLLDLGADPDAVNDWGVSSIHCAAVSGSLESLDALKTDQKIIESNAIFKYCFHNPTRNQLLDSYLMNYEDFQIVRSIPSDSFVRSSIGALIEAGFNINGTEENGQTALFHACRSNQLRLVTFLCRKGADVRATDLDGRTVLHDAFRFAGMDLVRMLRTKKLRVEVKDGKGESMVHVAAGSTTEAVQKLQYLLEEENVPLEEDHAGRTVLFPAVEIGDSGVVEFLIDKGIDVRKPDNHGVTLVQIARERNHENLLANVFKDL